jgi:predicted Zn-dependent protease
VTSVFGKRTATVTTNRPDAASLEEAVRRSEALAKLAPENPEYMGELPAQKYLAVSAPSGTAGMAHEGDGRAAAAAHAFKRARDAGLVAAGFLDTVETARALANNQGLFAFHTGAGAAHTLTIRSAEGGASGWAGGESTSMQGLDHPRIAKVAIEKCMAGTSPRDLEPGLYTAILEPTAAGMLLSRLLEHLDARGADEGRSYFAKPGGGNRIGETLFNARVTVESDPAIPGAEASPFDPADGLRRGPVRWIERGVLRKLVTSRYWAKERGVDAVAPPGNLVLSVEGERTLEELIAGTDRGVLITRFWYIRGLNPRAMSYTGLTRDGTFLIEDGKVVAAVNGFRFNQSLGDLLKHLDGATRPERVAASEASSVGMPILAPAIRVRDFNLASRSDAV